MQKHLPGNFRGLSGGSMPDIRRSALGHVGILTVACIILSAAARVKAVALARTTAMPRTRTERGAAEIPGSPHAGCCLSLRGARSKDGEIRRMSQGGRGGERGGGGGGGGMLPSRGRSGIREILRGGGGGGKKSKKMNEDGLSVSKSEDFGQWYSQLVVKSEMVEYTDVSGCYILRPWSFSIWEEIQSFMDAEIKKRKVKPSYFPLFITERGLNTEKDHVQVTFSPNPSHRPFTTASSGLDSPCKFSEPTPQTLDIPVGHPPSQTLDSRALKTHWTISLESPLLPHTLNPKHSHPRPENSSERPQALNFSKSLGIAHARRASPQRWRGSPRADVLSCPSPLPSGRPARLPCTRASPSKSIYAYMHASIYGGSAGLFTHTCMRPFMGDPRACSEQGAATRT
jgi:hypothetical protein